MQIIFQYLSTNFDGEIGLPNEVISKVLGHPYGCIKQLLQQQVPTIKINK
jgi:hypothetical protein